MATVARVAFDKTQVPADKSDLLDPFLPDEESLIKLGDDFTISINTVSKSVLDNYRDFYQAGKHQNNYFILLSEFSLGNQENAVKLHLVEPISSFRGTGAIEDVWARNVEVVENYGGEKGETPILNLSFSAFCQSIGKTPEDKLKESIKNIVSRVGSMIPVLAPFTTVGTVVVEGISNILNKPKNHPAEVLKESCVLFFDDPSNLGDRVTGEKPLQTGQYVIFFDESNKGEVDFKDLKMQTDGSIANTDRAYIVITLKRGIELAPGSIEPGNLRAVLGTREAAKVMENFNVQDNFVGASLGNKKLLDEIERLGSYVATVKSVKKYLELKTKTERTPEDEKKLAELKVSKELSELISLL